MKSRNFYLLFFSFATGIGLALGILIFPGANFGLVHAASVKLFVKADGVGTACTQAAPCPLATAMDQSLDSHTIYIATGEYTSTGPAVITITKSITLTGGWDGNPSGDLNINHVLYPTTLNGEDARRVVNITGDITPTLSGLRVTHGNDSSQLGGGGIRSYYAHPNIIGCHIFNNSALYHGGIYFYESDRAALVESDIYSNTALTDHAGGVGIRNSSDVVLSDNSIYSNTTEGNGGGINIISSSPVTLSGQEIYNNTSRSTSNGGGGIYLEAFSFDPQSEILIIGSQIYSNHVSLHGGGIYVKKIISLTLSSTDIYNHHAAQGGGIYANDVGYTNLTGNNIYDNAADTSGGGLKMNGGGFVSIRGNKIYDNLVGTNVGGGAYITYHSAVELVGNQVFSNTAYGTGGVHFENTDNIIVRDNEIFSNTATVSSGGGISLFRTESAIMTNNIVWGNTAKLQGGGVMPFLCDECLLRDNQVFRNESVTAQGGGINLSYSPTSTLWSNQVYSNTAHGNGGGIHLLESSNVDIWDNTVANNTATRTDSQGGGIALSSSHNVRIARNTISGNAVAGTGGGLGLGGSDNADIIANQIYQNTSVDDGGGGLWFGSCNPIRMENNMIFGNQVPVDKFGSGIYTFQTDLYLTHNTIADNLGGIEQGLFAVGAVDPSNTWMTNNIFANQNMGFVSGNNSSITATHTLFYGNNDNHLGYDINSTNEFSSYPAFHDPTDNDYHISYLSAARDIGLDAGVLFDIDGDPRPFLGDADIGADELTCLVRLNGVDKITVQVAVMAAVPFDEIQISGTCRAPRDSENLVSILKSVTLQGGYDPSFTTRDPQIYPTILDGETQRRVVFINGNSEGGIEVALDGLQIINGGAEDLNIQKGAGIFASQTLLTLNDSYVYNNTTPDEGGGIFLASTDGVTITNSHIYSNAAGMSGGGIYLLQVQNANLTSNQIHHNLAGDPGGGLFLRVCDFCTLEGNQVYANSSSGHGGGMYVYSSNHVVLLNNMIFENIVGEDNCGSGLYVNNTDLQMTNNTVAANGDEWDGNGFPQSSFFINRGHVQMTNTIASDQPYVFIIGTDSTLTATHTLFHNNLGNFYEVGGIYTSTHEFSGDPLYVNPAGYDYHIGGGSAALDKGLEIPWRMFIFTCRWW